MDDYVQRVRLRAYLIWRPHRHARQSRRRTAALPLRPGRQRRAGTLGSGRADGAGYRRGMADLARSLAGPLAASRAPVADPGTDRNRRAAARPSARQLHLARRPAPREMRRWSRARLRRMVEARRRADRGARLFPGRGRGGRALLDLSRRRWRGRRGFETRRCRAAARRDALRRGDERGCHDRLAPLVPAWDFRMSAARYVELQCTSHFSFLARGELLRGTVRPGRGARHRGAGDRRPQQPRRHRPRP